MAFSNPTVADFKNRFDRDFPYGVTTDFVKDSDINRALGNMIVFINQNLLTTQDEYTEASLLLSAHFLVMNLRNSSQGIAGQYSFLQSSKSVGSISESLAIPQRFLDNPEFSMLSKTTYGAQFLFYVLPGLSGQVYTVAGCTKP